METAGWMKTSLSLLLIPKTDEQTSRALSRLCVSAMLNLDNHACQQKGFAGALTEPSEKQSVQALATKRVPKLDSPKNSREVDSFLKYQPRCPPSLPINKNEEE